MNEIYLNTAGAGKVHPETTKEIPQILKRLSSDPSEAFLEWLFEDSLITRELLAKYSNCNSRNIALLPNTSYGVGAVASAVEGKIKNVLLYRHDYPSLNMPFEKRDFRISYVDATDGWEIDPSNIRKIIRREGVKLLAISDVQFLTGFAIDVENLSKLCREEGCKLLLDATQSFGLRKWDLEKTAVDVLIASSYKWIQGGYGTAVMAMRDKFIEDYPSVSPGFGSMQMEAKDWSYQAGIKSYEPGHLNMLGFHILHKSLERRFALGLDEKEHLSRDLMQHLLVALKERQIPIVGDYSMKHRAGIICIPMQQSDFEKLAKKGLKATYRKGSLRLGIHHYNTIEELDLFMEYFTELVPIPSPRDTSGE